ncbi:MAG TPA: Rieske 2Fe-2S domain-containing protein [Candidatus Dormibacteraeota bacterium]|nr:Rieske 2Fe-2S domain-containing protein [Candidatus Dormibacteraeota bacterium]
MRPIAVEQILERLGFLDPVADSLQKLVGRGLAAGGPAADQVKDLLNGRMLGHPLHPALTDLPIGAWSCSTLLDVADRGRGGELGRAADLLIGAGCLSGLAAAASGVADWQDSYGPERRMGLAHALLNTAALSLFGTSLLMRLGGFRRQARPLSLGAFLLAVTGAFLGGELVFRLGTQVNRNAWIGGPTEWTEIASSEELEPGTLLQRHRAGADILLARVGGKVCAVAAVCSHAGGPLQEGEVRGGEVICPWHGSRFDLRSGDVTHGPASVALPTFESRTTPDGKVEVRKSPG